LVIATCGAFLPASSTNLVQPVGNMMTWGVTAPFCHLVPGPVGRVPPSSEPSWKWPGFAYFITMQ
jgi:hypothetical protein